jgi:hypothetical protein
MAADTTDFSRVEFQLLPKRRPKAEAEISTRLKPVVSGFHSRRAISADA